MDACAPADHIEVIIGYTASGEDIRVTAEVPVAVHDIRCHEQPLAAEVIDRDIRGFAGFDIGEYLFYYGALPASPIVTDDIGRWWWGAGWEGSPRWLYYTPPVHAMRRRDYRANRVAFQALSRYGMILCDKFGHPLNCRVHDRNTGEGIACVDVADFASRFQREPTGMIPIEYLVYTNLQGSRIVGDIISLTGEAEGALSPSDPGFIEQS